MRLSVGAATLACLATSAATRTWLYLCVGCYNGKALIVPPSDCAPCSPSSDVVWTNETIFPVANTTDIEALKALCNAEPTCVGFNSHGWLKNASTSVASNPVDLYLASDAPAPSTPLVWPRPAAISVGTSSIVVSPVLSFVATTPSADLSAAFTRTLALIFSNGPGGANATRFSAAQSKAYPVLDTVTVTVADVNAPLQLGVNETYTLTLPAAGGSGLITAATVFGAYAALQTLSQLVAFDFDAGLYWSGAPVAVSDGPRFPWRGLMVDPARHFLPPATLRATVDAMTYAKLNTLHVHVVDCDSWPLQVWRGWRNAAEGKSGQCTTSSLSRCLPCQSCGRPPSRRGSATRPRSSR